MGEDTLGIKGLKNHIPEVSVVLHFFVFFFKFNFKKSEQTTKICQKSEFVP